MENIIKNKSFQFALRIVKLCKILDERREYVLGKQLLRSGTAIGALVREGEHAESRADFIHKMSIALKEANETSYWIELLFAAEIIDSREYTSINDGIVELLKLLISIVKTSKKELDCN